MVMDGCWRNPSLPHRVYKREDKERSFSYILYFIWGNIDLHLPSPPFIVTFTPGLRPLL